MSASPAPESTSQWKEYKNAEGRVYWSHALTKQSVWEKPDELRTPFERAMGKTPWKQYTSGGKPYYVNSSTKETVWNLPPDLVKLKEEVEALELQKREREHRRATGQASPSPGPEDSAAGSGDEEGALTRYRGAVAPSKTPEPEPEQITIPVGGFKSIAAAEEAFMYLLKREGIDETWTWDATMRKIVLDPLFKALDTLSAKQLAFEKWQAQLVKEKAEAREARIAELRPKLRRLFAQSGQIKSYSTLKTADKVFSADKYYKRAKPDERRLLLEEYTSELRTHEAAARKLSKEHNIASLSKLIRNLDITVASRWHDARQAIMRSDAFAKDPQLAKMEPLDMLNVYDEYARQLEKEFDEESRRLRVESRRKARKARDGFKALLRELRDRGSLTRTSKWKETLPLLRSEERYTALLGLPGSTPLELWMDAVDDLQLEAEEKAARIENALKETVRLETTFEAFNALCGDAGVPASPEARKDAFDIIHHRLEIPVREEARRHERKRRHRIEDLRDALRKVRSVEADTSYEDALPHISDLPEFKVLEDEDRRAAFERHTARLKEKAREREERERDRGGRMDVDDDRDRERDRDRDRDRRRNLWDKDGRADRDRDWRDRRDRDRSRERERERERDRDRDHRRHDYRDRDRSRRDRSEDDRDTKRRRVSSPPSSRHDKEEGEI